MTSSEFYMKLVENEAFKDPLSRGELVFQILQRAKELKIKGLVESQIKNIEKELTGNSRKKVYQSTDGVTNFGPDITGREYPNLWCGSWIATEDGIVSQESSRANQVACYHPILPVKRLRNEETGEEQITLAFKRGDCWNEFTIPKEIIANSKTITSLSKYGVAVTSETAKLLVRYLADVENYNEDKVILVKSSSKLGWHKDNRLFLPFDDIITFDSALKFSQITNAITEQGSYEIWLEHIKKIRSDSYIEPRIALAASFASVIIKFLNIASVIIDFWGMTEAGKTVMLMVAASVWACPDEGAYIGDFLTTDAELEVRSDMLNNLPLILDDTAKMRKGIKDNIEQVIYNLSSGTGKKRSNKELGSERVRTWKNAVIVNGERPLNSFVSQGGAFNRIIEIGLNEEKLFNDPRITAETVRNNYGYAGKEFVASLKRIDVETIRKRHAYYVDQLTTENTMQKQVVSMAAILVGDELATTYVFRDGNALKADDVKGFLTDRQQISDGIRCYEFLMDTLEEKGQHFDAGHDNLDQWGWVEVGAMEKIINFYPSAINRILSDAGFSRKAFSSWAKREGLLITNGPRNESRDTRSVRHINELVRVFSIKKVEDLSEYLEDRALFK